MGTPHRPLLILLAVASAVASMLLAASNCCLFVFSSFQAQEIMTWKIFSMMMTSTLTLILMPMKQLERKYMAFLEISPDGVI